MNSSTRKFCKLVGKDFVIYSNITSLTDTTAFVNTLYLLPVGTPFELQVNEPYPKEEILLFDASVTRIISESSSGNMEDVGLELEINPKGARELRHEKLRIEGEDKE